MFINVQYLRAVAALMVVYQHAQFLHHPAWGGFFGALGVDIFFGISGFVIFATTLKDFRLSNYLLKRAIRVVPLYWVLTLVMAALVTFAPRLFSSTTVTLSHFLQSLLFIPHYSPSQPDEIEPLLPPGWTLDFEMFFYASFGLLLVMCRSRLRFLIALTSVFVLLIGGGLLTAPSGAIAITYTSWRLAEFLIGAWAAYLLLSRPQLPMTRPTTWALMAVGWLLLIYVGFFDGGLAPRIAAVFAVVFSAAVLDRLEKPSVNQLFKLLGDASYSIYLVHIFILGAMKQILLRTMTVNNSPLQVVAFIAIAVILSSGVGVVVYRLFEVPVLRFLRNAFLKPKDPVGIERMALR